MGYCTCGHPFIPHIHSNTDALHYRLISDWDTDKSPQTLAALLTSKVSTDCMIQTNKHWILSSQTLDVAGDKGEVVMNHLIMTPTR